VHPLIFLRIEHCQSRMMRWLNTVSSTCLRQPGSRSRCSRAMQLRDHQICEPTTIDGEQS